MATLTFNNKTVIKLKHGFFEQKDFKYYDLIDLKIVKIIIDPQTKITPTYNGQKIKYINNYDKHKQKIPI